MSKHFGDGAVSANYDGIIIFPFDLEQCGTWIPDARSMIPEFSLIEVVYLTKIENRSKKFLTSLIHYCFDLSYHFCQKMLNFAKTILKLAKIKGVPYLRTKFLP